MALFSQMSVATRRSFQGRIRNLKGLDAGGDALALMMLANMPPPKMGALQLGVEVVARIRKSTTHWYSGLSTTTVSQPPLHASGRARWYFHKTDIAMANSDLRQNSGVSMFDLLRMENLTELGEDQATQLFDIQAKGVQAAKEDSFESLANAITNGGVGAATPTAQVPLAMEGLNTIFDNTKTLHEITPTQFGAFDADDVWFDEIAAVSNSPVS